VSIGHLPGGSAGSDVTALSRDGSTAVGWSKSAAGTEAIRFKNGVLQSLGDFEGGDTNSRAICVSADGNAIGGQGCVWRYVGTYSTNTYPPLIWREGVGIQGSGGYAVNGEVRAITPDGTTWAVSGDRGCPWLSNAGWVGNEFINGGNTDIRALSDDGFTCFGGRMDIGNPYKGNETCTRFVVDGFSGTRVASGSNLECSYCSSDGSCGVSSGGREGVYQWSASGVSLIAGTAGISVRGVSPDLKTMTGSIQAAATSRAAIWTRQSGVVTLENYIHSTFGTLLDLGSFSLTCCNGISGNGLVFAGSGVNGAGQQEGWVLQVVYDWNDNGIDDAQEIREGLIADINRDGIADCYQSGIDCPGPNLAANPGFEAGNALGDCTSELLTAGTSTGAWQVVLGVAERANRPKTCSSGGWAAEFGAYAIELRSTGGGPGTIRQAITAEPGRHYRVSFWMSANCSNGSSVSVRASAGNSSKIFNRTCDGTGRQSWLRCEFDFVAVLTTELLEFASENQPFSGPVIDAISVSDVTVGCPSDLDGNGQVDTADIGLLLLNFGPCE